MLEALSDVEEVPGRRLVYMPLTLLKEATRNPKKHMDEDIGKSIGRFGYVEPIVLDERTKRLVAGHGRLSSLRRRRDDGEEPPEGIRAQGGEWLVPVIRGWGSRDDVEAEAYLLASNQLTIGGGWDNNLLAELLKGLDAADALDGTGFDMDSVTALLDSLQAPAPPDIDDVPEPSTHPYVEKGQLYQLGAHRIICGDSTSGPDVDRLMVGELADMCWTDPPWNVAYDKELSTGRGKAGAGHAPIANDNLGEDFPQFIAAFVAEMKRVLKPGAMLYLVMSSNEMPTIATCLKEFGFHWSSNIVWAKDSFVVGRKDYHAQFEQMWYGWLDGAPRLHPVPDRKQSDLWTVARPKVSAEHPTMKPVELIQRALLNSSKRSDLVYEPFSGSGSTLLACELTGRACRAIELEPKYVQVAIERWEKQTSLKAELVA